MREPTRDEIDEVARLEREVMLLRADLEFATAALNRRIVHLRDECGIFSPTVMIDVERGRWMNRLGVGQDGAPITAPVIPTEDEQKPPKAE